MRTAGSACTRLLPRVLSTTVGRHRLKRPKSANPQDSLRIDGRAVLGSTCCRRMEYDPSRHRLKRLGSLVFQADRADSRLLPRPGSARFHLLPRRPRESFGHRLEPQDSSFSENSREVPHKSCANPSTCFAGTSPFRGGVDDVLLEDRGHFIRGVAYLFSYSPRGSKCFPGKDAQKDVISLAPS